MRGTKDAVLLLHSLWSAINEALYFVIHNKHKGVLLLALRFPRSCQTSIRANDRSRKDNIFTAPDPLLYIEKELKLAYIKEDSAKYGNIH